MSYYLYDNQQQTGPYSIEKLKSLWRSGSISGEAFYCEEGYSEWCPLRTLMEVEPSRKPSPFASTIPPIIAAVIPNKKPHSKVIFLSACLGCLVILFITLYLSGGSSSHDSNQAVLFIEGLGSIPVATDESALDDLTRYAQTGDNLSKESLLNSTRGFRVPNGTKVRFASGGLTSSKVEILQGPHKGEIVCVYSE